jgi:Family of unknown function (DUF6334)
MEPETAHAVARALFTKLSAFQEMKGRSLLAVEQIYEHRCLARIVLDFGEVSLVITAEAEDDSIGFCSAKGSDGRAANATNAGPDFWKELIGVRFSWGWITVNQQGYCDGVLLSFDGIDPDVLMIVRASSLTCRRIP